MSGVPPRRSRRPAAPIAGAKAHGRPSCRRGRGATRARATGGARRRRGRGHARLPTAWPSARHGARRGLRSRCHGRRGGVPAFTIPNRLCGSFLGEGAVAERRRPGPIEEKLARGRRPSRRVVSLHAFRGVSVVALLFVTAAGMAFAGPLTELFAAGYRARPGELERTRHAPARAVFPYIFFMGTAALGMAATSIEPSLCRRCLRARPPQRGASRRGLRASRSPRRERP